MAENIVLDVDPEDLHDLELEDDQQVYGSSYKFYFIYAANIGFTIDPSWVKLRLNCYNILVG